MFAMLTSSAVPFMVLFSVELRKIVVADLFVVLLICSNSFALLSS